MKLVLNIEKRHLIFFSLFLVLVGSIFVIAPSVYNQAGTAPASGVGHQDLYANNIYSWAKTGFIKIWDAKGNDLQLGSQFGENNRFDFSVDSGDRVTFYGRTGPNYQMDRFTVKAENIALIGRICSDEQGTKCISVDELIDNAEGGTTTPGEGTGDGIFYGEDIKIDDKRIYGQLTAGVNNYMGGDSARQFCKEQQGMTNLILNKFESENCPVATTITIYYQNDIWDNSESCDSRYGLLKKVECRKSDDVVSAYGSNRDTWNNNGAKPNWNCNIQKTSDLNIIYTKEFTGAELVGKSYIEFASIGTNTHENNHLMLNAVVERKVGTTWESLTTTADGTIWIGDKGNWESGSTTNKYYGCEEDKECIRAGKITITDTMKNGDALRVKVLACGNHEGGGDQRDDTMGYFVKSVTSVILKQ